MKKIVENIIIEDGRKYFDFTASGLAYAPIEESISKILETYANTHSDSNRNALITQKHYDHARESLKNSFGLDDSFCLLPIGSGASGAIKKFQEIMGLYISPKTQQRYKIEITNKPLVIVGPFEHHSNEVSFREAICDVVRIPLNRRGFTDLKVLEEVLKENKDREIIGSFSAASNVTGILNPIEEISQLIRKYGGILAIDCATSSAYMNIDSSLYDAMFLSPHKLLGGVGSSGILVLKKALFDKDLAPTFGGGGTVSYVSKNQHIFLDDIETREDAGTPAILQFIKASLAYQLRDTIGLKTIYKKEQELRNYFLEKIKSIDNLELYCNNQEKKLTIFSFNIKGKNPYDIAKNLSKNYNIDVRAGCSCAGPYGHELLHLEDNIDNSNHKLGWVRVSLHYTHSYSDIDFLISALS